jgi:parallel beta-helix repeat protein
MLDHAGEWLYDASAGKLYLWAPNNDNPVNHTVELSTRQYGIQIVGKNYVTIQNLGVKNANQYDVSVSNADNITLSHLNISGGLMGVYSTGVTNYLVRNNTIENTLSNGIHVVSNSSNIDISNNNINNAGNVGISPKQSDGGINVQGISINIHDNAVTNSGYIGIQFEGDHDVVENNLIDNSCLVLDDCGGVYTYPMGYKVTGNSIIGNTIKNTIGNFEGTPKTVPQAIGIYLDDLSYNVKVLNNSIYNADRGIFVHSGYSNTITGNAIYGSRTLGLVISEDGGGSFAKTSNSPGTVHDNVVIGNRIENLSTGPTVSYYSVINGNPLNFGTYNNNQYCHPNSNLMISNASKNYTLGDWQKFSGQDLNSTDVKSYCDKTPIIPVNASSIRQTNEAPANPIYVQVNSPSAPPNVATQAVVQQNVLNSNPKPLVYPDTSVVNTKLNTSAKTFSAKPTAFKTITNLDNSLLTIPTTTIDIVVPKVPSWIEVLVDLFKEIVSRIKMGAGKTMLEIRGLVMVRQTITTK